MIIAALTHPEATSNLYLHVRVLLGMIVGIDLTHLLRHFARIVEQPKRDRMYWIHLRWALSMFVYMLHFWWWEVRLANIHNVGLQPVSFRRAVRVAAIPRMRAGVPEDLEQHGSYRDYFSIDAAGSSVY